MVAQFDVGVAVSSAICADLVGGVSLEFFFPPALSLHCSLSCSVSSDLPSQPMSQERMAPNKD